MKVLVINAGSSSLKFQLIDMQTKEVVAKGNVEKINEGGSFLKYKSISLKKKLSTIAKVWNFCLKN